MRLFLLATFHFSPTSLDVVRKVSIILPFYALHSFSLPSWNLFRLLFFSPTSGIHRNNQNFMLVWAGVMGDADFLTRMSTDWLWVWEITQWGEWMDNNFKTNSEKVTVSEWVDFMMMPKPTSRFFALVRLTEKSLWCSVYQALRQRAFINLN